MNTMFLYFAYGSNMNPARMAKRCPGAIDLGGAVLRNHRVVERLYAEIDFEEGSDMQGVLYVITEEHLRKLDRFEDIMRDTRGLSRFCLKVKKSGLPLDKNGFMLIQEQRSRVVRFKKQEDKP